MTNFTHHRQISFSRLWGNQAQRASRDYTPYITDDHAKEARDQAYRDAIRSGWKARRSTLKNQCRQYWGFADPCDDYCTVYFLDVYQTS